MTNMIDNMSAMQDVESVVSTTTPFFRHSPLNHAQYVCLSGNSLDENIVSEAITIAFKELVENAIHHAADARPSIWITAESTIVSFQTEKAAAVRIHIEDANSIIPDIDLARLLGDEESPVHHGTGLGLWLVNWIVVMSGGIIQHTERDDGGNKISITLVEATE